MPPLIYYSKKLSHTGVTVSKTFEGYNRKMSKNSLRNLLNQAGKPDWLVKDYAAQYTEAVTEPEKEKVYNFVKEHFDMIFFYAFERLIDKGRILNQKQVRSIKQMCGKLAYYSSTRKFESKKSGKHYMKVAFLTLTAPEQATNEQIIKAFNHFLDYLSRTAKCNYVWKKEHGDNNGLLHMHIMINNFIPYYIISWKWKRLLMSEGVDWPVTEKGKHTDSHYRIELPKSKRATGYYIAKYMSKGDYIEKSLGYIWGKSQGLEDCKELILIEDHIIWDEMTKIFDHFKVIGDKWVQHVCVDILKIKELTPKIYNYFLEQYKEFQAVLSLPQHFFYVEEQLNVN